MAGPGLAASVLYKLITGRDTAGPAFANWIKAQLIGFRRIYAGQSNLGGVDLDCIAINNSGHAADVRGHGGRSEQQGGKEKAGHGRAS